MLDGLSLRARRTLAAWTFLALPIVFYATIRFYPTADALLTSLTDWNIVGPRRFVSLDNYRRLFSQKQFGNYLTNSLMVTSASVVLALVAGSLGGYAIARFRLLDDRDFAEYYLLGTLASVSVAIVTALAARAALP